MKLCKPSSIALDNRHIIICGDANVLDDRFDSQREADAFYAVIGRLILDGFGTAKCRDGPFLRTGSISIDIHDNLAISAFYKGGQGAGRSVTATPVIDANEMTGYQIES